MADYLNNNPNFSPKNNLGKIVTPATSSNANNVEDPNANTANLISKNTPNAAKSPEEVLGFLGQNAAQVKSGIANQVTLKNNDKYMKVVDQVLSTVKTMPETQSLSEASQHEIAFAAAYKLTGPN